MSELIGSSVLLGHLLAAALSDVRHRRVANPLVLSLATLGFVAAFAGIPLGHTALRALGGLLVMTLLWFPMYAFRLMGAGDVKLLMASGAWLGWPGALLATLG